MDVFVDLLLLAGRALGPIIRRFISLGLNRVWTKAGDTVYRQGEPAESLYILISGRLRLLRADPDGEGPMVVEEEVGSFETAMPCCHLLLPLQLRLSQGASSQAWCTLSQLGYWTVKQGSRGVLTMWERHLLCCQTKWKMLRR